MPTESAFANSVLEANTRKTIEVNMILFIHIYVVLVHASLYHLFPRF